MKTKYTTIIYSEKKEMGVSFMEYVVLDIIAHLENSTRFSGCQASTAYFAESLDVTERYIKKIFSKLESEGWMTSTGNGGRGARASRKTTEKYKQFTMGLNSEQKDTVSSKKTINSEQKDTRNSEQKDIHSIIDTYDITYNTADQRSAGNLEEEKSRNRDIVEVLDQFKKAFPNFPNMYGNKTQRKACSDLVETYGLEKILSTIKVLPQVNRVIYQQSTTPLELWRNYEKMRASLEREKNTLNKNKRRAI